MTDNPFIHIGTLTRPHGLKGEVCVDWFGEDPALLKGPFFLQAGDTPPQAAKAKHFRMHKGQPLLVLENISDRTAAESVRGLKVLVHSNDLPALDDDEVYLHTIIGLEVVRDEDGQSLGILDHVEFPGGQELWAIQHASGKEILLPAVEEFIVAFEVEQGRIRVAPPEGLLELYVQADEPCPTSSAR
ncbi:MAG: ribosome maturation factor RimM [Desulfovibrionaceae bacterium]